MPESTVMLDGGSEAIVPLGINPSQLLALINHLDHCIGFRLLLCRHWRTPWIKHPRQLCWVWFIILNGYAVEIVNPHSNKNTFGKTNGDVWEELGWKWFTDRRLICLPQASRIHCPKRLVPENIVSTSPLFYLLSSMLYFFFLGEHIDTSHCLIIFVFGRTYNCRIGIYPNILQADLWYRKPEEDSDSLPRNLWNHVTPEAWLRQQSFFSPTHSQQNPLPNNHHPNTP